MCTGSETGHWVGQGNSGVGLEAGQDQGAWVPACDGENHERALSRKLTQPRLHLRKIILALVLKVNLEEIRPEAEGVRKLMK